ncbi:MAG: hypothetical protein DWH73_02660 [Planctomycetota bacterium]|nr:MAG: hypothetical protein DWH73_02660 [Planctomycetota bacterium]
MTGEILAEKKRVGGGRGRERSCCVPFPANFWVLSKFKRIRKLKAGDEKKAGFINISRWSCTGFDKTVQMINKKAV